HLPPNLLRGDGRYALGDLVPLAAIKRVHIRRVLDATGTIKGAAAVLGINPTTLARRLKREAANDGIHCSDDLHAGGLTGSPRPAALGAPVPDAASSNEYDLEA